MSTIARIALCLLLALPPGMSFAQEGALAKALRHYQAGELAAARTVIDEVVNGPAHAGDPQAWLLRGFIYKDIYKAAPDSAAADEVRDEAMASLYTSVGLDKNGAIVQNAKQAYDYLVRTCFNDAAHALNALDADRAITMFRKYQEAVLRMDPDTDLSARELEFNNALGTVYTKRFNSDRTDLVWFDKAVATYEAVLAKDPGNYGANYNLATVYFNRGVYNIQRITADDDIPSIEKVQEASRELFLKALPYMLKAHDMNPSRRETLIGLEGIYYSLQDEQRSDKLRELFKTLPPEDDR
jgi:tetratricopeptide (TPR) repeat protein